MKIVYKINKYIEDKGYKKKSIAEKAHIKADKFSRILNANCTLTLLDYVNICNALDVDYGYFIEKETQKGA